MYICIHVCIYIYVHVQALISHPNHTDIEKQLENTLAIPRHKNNRQIGNYKCQFYTFPYSIIICLVCLSSVSYLARFWSAHFTVLLSDLCGLPPIPLGQTFLSPLDLRGATFVSFLPSGNTCQPKYAISINSLYQNT